MIEAHVREWCEQILVEVVLAASISTWSAEQLEALLSPTAFTVALLPRHRLHAILQKRLGHHTPGRPDESPTPPVSLPASSSCRPFARARRSCASLSLRASSLRHANPTWTSSLLPDAATSQARFRAQTRSAVLAKTRVFLLDLLIATDAAAIWQARR